MHTSDDTSIPALYVVRGETVDADTIRVHRLTRQRAHRIAHDTYIALLELDSPERRRLFRLRILRSIDRAQDAIERHRLAAGLERLALHWPVTTRRACTRKPLMHRRRPPA